MTEFVVCISKPSHKRTSQCSPEPECCDGSDEPSGVCPNQCKEIGEKYRAEREAERKLRKTGAKIRSSYIAYAKKEAARLQGAINSLKKEVEEKRIEETRLKSALEHTESVDAAALEHQKQSPLYKSLVSHNAALTSLRSKQADLQAKLDTLEEILANLKRSYNPNYQDMGVLEAVRGWDAYHGVEPESESTTKQAGTDPLATEAEILEAQANSYVTEGDSEHQPAKDPEPVKEDEWTTAKLDKLARADHVALLLEHSRHISGPQSDNEREMDTIQAYLPDALIPVFLNLKTWLTGSSQESTGETSEATVNARNAHNSAADALRKSERELKDSEEALAKLETGGYFGKDGEWKKLDGVCLEKDTGEYTYSVCLFGSATQKSNRDHASHSLGRFSGWNDKEGVTPGSYDYYTRQYYKGGARCWNGPERSVILDLTCGTENTIQTIAEPEKCEYLFTGTSPALCWPLDDRQENEKDDAAQSDQSKSFPTTTSMTSQARASIFPRAERGAFLNNQMHAVANSTGQTPQTFQSHVLNAATFLRAQREYKLIGLVWNYLKSLKNEESLQKICYGLPLLHKTLGIYVEDTDTEYQFDTILSVGLPGDTVPLSTVLERSLIVP
ncbi:endoplasmic reticulum protein [Rhizoctonia solani AG-1 IA]|uniref:Glucosidase 2 subunit beta n=1 Tax=Thanatephorus cucumeris (strain AG1-IA) TaxID=983506 RepID=L8X226_THACA|nr:endoplasmic reticulum protein [Rhizoctonia solani AG-1 IA]